MYLCRLTDSPRFGRVYEVTKVPGRTHILIHAGNYAGDTRFGLRTDTQGCILIGGGRGRLKGQNILVASRKALRDFMAALGGQDFYLQVVGGYDGFC